MLYQLENGKVLYLSLEEYLSLTDEELNQIASCNVGEEPSSKMYYGRQAKNIVNPDEHHRDIDYIPDTEEPSTIGPTSIEDLLE